MTGKSGGQPRREYVAERHPNLTERPRLEYRQRMLGLVEGRREAMARQNQQPAQARSPQEQPIRGRNLSQSLETTKGAHPKRTRKRSHQGRLAFRATSADVRSKTTNGLVLGSKVRMGWVSDLATGPFNAPG